MLTLVFLSVLALVSSQLLSTEIAALCSLPSALTGFPASWSCAANVTGQCSWPGVVCSPSGQTVQSIDLTGFTLTGTIPDLVWSLEAITGFKLAGNAGVTGSIPSAIGDTNTLQTLILSSLSLTGIVPQTIGNIVSLVNLDLSNNQLTGVIPSNIFQCTYLSTVNLSSNQFSGVLPDLSSLPITSLNIKSTTIDGCFPRGLSDTMTSCDASTNSFFCDCPAPALCSSQLCCYIVSGLEKSNLHCSNGSYTSTAAPSQVQVATLTVNIPATQAVNISSDMSISSSLAITAGYLQLNGNIVIRSSSTVVLSLGAVIVSTGGCIDISNSNLNLYINGASVSNGTSYTIIQSNCVVGDFNNTLILDSNCYDVNNVVTSSGVQVSFVAKYCTPPLSAEAILAIVFCNVIFFGLILFGIYYFMSPELQEHVFQISDDKDSMILHNKFIPSSSKDVEFV